MKNRVAAIDLSLRSTAVVILNTNKELIGFCIVSNSKLNEEDLLVYNSSCITNFIFDHAYGAVGVADDNLLSLDKIVIEELSYNSVSSMSDMIAANKWMTRARLKLRFPNTDIGQVSVKQWRSSVISKAEQAAINEKYLIVRAKKGLKLAKEQIANNNKSKQQIKKETKNLTVSKLPEDVKEAFEKYIQDKNLKKDAIFDLADAWHLCSYYIDKTYDN